MNTRDEPMILSAGEEIGQWGTEKWKESWEDLNPLMLDNAVDELSFEDRQRLLFDQIKTSSNVAEICADVRDVLDEFADAFAVCDRELTGTKIVEMDIDTGEHKPIKMKTRPVPLGIRKKLKDLLEDLEKRQIIEKSHSEWAFPIVLVEKKDGSLRLCVDYRVEQKDKARLVSITHYRCGIAKPCEQEVFLHARSL
ncbi:hypothetical protein Y032_0541g3183 [Ancylostoma ceylanicum]|uniref:Reverse transcriptase domain-containing protein n=1 Tax=Ancylostoma ceylanicum TaxID=53326 RepID=A0A016WR56_9BILA|nr:hypothetical protein Y032_0541g3183 [Ancylostoma ceylanicum]